MSDVYVVCNQLNQFWGKKKRWVDGRRPREIAVFKHEDEGLNQLVELSARDVELRGRVDAAAVDERGIPDVVPSEHRTIDEDELAKQSTDNASAADADSNEVTPPPGDKAPDTDDTDLTDATTQPAAAETADPAQKESQEKSVAE